MFKTMLGVMTRLILITVIVWSVSAPAIAEETCQGQKMNWVDESSTDEVFKVFKEKLSEAVKNKDMAFITKNLDPKVLLSYDSERMAPKVIGAQNFNIQYPDQNKVWKTLSDILSMGGTFTDQTKQEFKAPYVYAVWPKDCPNWKYSAVIGKKVEVRTKPDSKSPVITELSDELVEVVNDKENQKDENWQKVNVKNTIGYVPVKSLRSCYDFSIRFVKKDDQWKITYFAELPKHTRGTPDPPL